MTIKETCLAEMRDSFDCVMAVLDTIPPERMTDVGVTEEWSVRDVLAHEAGYERYVAAAMFGDLTGQAPTNREVYGRDDAPTEADDASDDSTNAWVVAHARTLRVEAVLAEFRWAHDRLVEAVEACVEADFEDPSRFPSFKGKTLLAVLPNQCWGHHREHLRQLEPFARKISSPTRRPT
ncbi:MAG TPA: DinB family protein [Methylomirabilota bacterium]|nr:DinB family protein [Methylomirabilota bacterium]